MKNLSEFYHLVAIATNSELREMQDTITKEIRLSEKAIEIGEEKRK